MSVDRVVLVDPVGKRHLIDLTLEIVKIPRLGVVRTATLRESIGRRFKLGERSFLVLTPSVRDLMASATRGAQIVGSKDAAALVWNADLKSGDLVIEVGAGSGVLTTALARAVTPGGRVVTYELRRDHLELARRNVAAAGYGGAVEFKLGDGRLDLVEREANACVIDIPDPWMAVSGAWAALGPCGHLSTFSPNMEQVKETVAAIRKKPFVDVRTIELIEREMEVRDVGVRPSFAALGHTGYLTFARKVLDTF